MNRSPSAERHCRGYDSTIGLPAATHSSNVVTSPVGGPLPNAPTMKAATPIAIAMPATYTMIRMAVLYPRNMRNREGRSVSWQGTLSLPYNGIMTRIRLAIIGILCLGLLVASAVYLFPSFRPAPDEMTALPEQSVDRMYFTEATRYNDPKGGWEVETAIFSLDPYSGYRTRPP